MIKYVFRDGPVAIKGGAKANPQVIGEALEAIRSAGGGDLKPKAVVDAARRKSHPLHKHFEWEDAVAAEAYRLDQARALIRVVRVVDEETAEGNTRAFISINENRRVAYRSAEQVKTSADLQLAVLKQAQRDLEAFERRYRELKDICAIVQQAREAIAARQIDLETREAA